MLVFLETEAGLISSRYVVRLSEEPNGWQVRYMDGGQEARMAGASKDAVARFMAAVEG